ncbi:hypothetical protein [Trueperella sp. LYQ143]|uniref:hypothetical protein n=1 Tax=Trueperella sp. LYQ143 TaxID=3391059 RepID=UPI003983B1AA
MSVTYTFDDVCDTAIDVETIATEGGCLNDLWRFGILQTIDLYQTAINDDGIEGGIKVFAREPITSVSEINCGYAALANYFANRDGWNAPEWANRPCRCTAPWFPAQRPEYPLPQRVIKLSIEETPDEFRQRNIFITLDDLIRV